MVGSFAEEMYKIMELFLGSLSVQSLDSPLPGTNLTAEDNNNCIPKEFSGLLSAISSSQSVCRVNASTGEPLPIASTLFPPAPRTFPWEPRPHHYLLALCAYGRTSNNLFCLRRYAAFAALLNRTLIVPVVR